MVTQCGCLASDYETYGLWLTDPDSRALREKRIGTTMISAPLLLGSWDLQRPELFVASQKREMRDGELQENVGAAIYSMHMLIRFLS